MGARREITTAYSAGLAYAAAQNKLTYLMECPSWTSKWRPFMRRPAGETVTLDAIDRRIVAELFRDRELSNAELARRAGIAAPPCLRRVRRLEEAGVIQGYTPSPQRLLGEITLFAIVGLHSQTETVLSAFEQRVAAWPEVRERHMIRGGGDFLLKIVARNATDEFDLTQRLTGLPGVRRVQTLQTIGAAEASRSATAAEIGAEAGVGRPSGAVAFGQQLQAGFASAVREATRAARKEGLAIPGRISGRAVEVLPNGEVRHLEENAPWSPKDWQATEEG
jgi:DNA-binding Lrp family transcriptional regulator